MTPTHEPPSPTRPGRPQDHAAAIEQIADYIDATYATTIGGHIKIHLDDLAAENAALAAQVTRLQAALEREVNRNRRELTLVPLTREQIEQTCRLQPGDMGERS